MTVKELASLLEGEVVGNENAKNEVSCGYCCDLLSWVMANGRAGCAWVTVQTHMNVVALASLHDMACIIFPENITPEDAPVKKAATEGIALIKSPLTAYKICGIMASNGIEDR